MSILERSPTEEPTPRTTEQQSLINKKFFYVLMTPYLHSGDIITLPNGEILKGDRNIFKSAEKNASQIINNKLPGFAPKSGKWIMNTEDNPYGMAYLAQRAHEKRHDMSHIEDLTDLSSVEDIPDHKHPLERHSYTSYMSRIALINAAADPTKSETPSRAAEEKFLKVYEDLILK